ncbi:hypothetical protein [uncultured Streptococcus sp.]|uniref:hypothetical protein n=1 Tax=uncultured Streptococcus sp. TaxID=83427 RepID=UPI0028D6EF0A|nr:hypothetical protein [uncultured Streptococcus sp.]
MILTPKSNQGLNDIKKTLKEKFYERKSFFDESKEIFSFIILNNKERAGGFRMQGI